MIKNDVYDTALHHPAPRLQQAPAIMGQAARLPYGFPHARKRTIQDTHHLKKRQLKEVEFLQQVKQCHGMILKLIGLYAYTVDDRNDLYQEIMLNAWKNVPQFRREARFSTWLYQLALNTILTANRNNKKHTRHHDLTDLVVPVHADAEAKEDLRRLYTAIRQLPEIDRAVISLHLEGYSNQEIADMTGIRANYAGVKLFRIKAQLQSYLNQ